VLKAADLLMGSSRTMRFEGQELDAAVSFFVVDMEPGNGPEVHRHPYAEVFIPISGSARFSTGDDELEAGPDSVIVVGPDQTHGFKSLERLKMVCIHANEKMVTDWLDGKGYS
jgi:mannose-6-phosphate isomerase-like protein (cupin superfamily)